MKQNFLKFVLWSCRGPPLNPKPEQLPESPHGPVDLPANKSIDNVVLLLLSFYVVGAKTTLVVDQVARAASTRICRQLLLLHGGVNMDGREAVASSLSARVSRVVLRFWEVLGDRG